MKKISIICLLAFIAVISVISCSKDIETVTPQNVTPQDVVVVNTSLLSLNELTEKVSDFNSEYASFENEDEFYNFLTSFDNLEEEEKNELLTKLPYQTLENYLDVAYEGMNDIETEEEFVDYIANRSNYFSIEKMDNGEKEIIELGESLHTASILLNASRIVKVGEEYSLFLDNERAYSEDYAELKTVKNSEDLVVSGLRQETVVEMIDAVQKVGWDEALDAEKVEDKFRCKNDRKIVFEMNAITSSFNGNIKQGRRFARVTAKRKGIPCFWYKFKADILWNNFRLEYFIGTDFISWTVGNTFQSNVKSITRNELIVQTTNGDDLPTFLWTKAVTVTTHDEMGGQALIIDVNL